MSPTKSDIIKELKGFISKYYSNKLVIGLIVTFLVYDLYIITIVAVESLSYLSVQIKTIIYYFSLVFLLFVALIFIIKPILKILKIGKVLNVKDVATIISEHFSQIEDKLINIIELEEESSKNESNVLLLASIRQKCEELKIFDFSEAFKFRIKKRFLVVSLFSIFISTTLFMLNKREFIEGYKRLLDYNTEYLPGATYSFEILNKDFIVKKGGDIDLSVALKGYELPSSVFIEIGNEKLLMERVKEGLFSCKIRNLYNSVSFRFTDNKYYSETYHIKVLPVPAIIDFTLRVEPPFYTGIKSDILNNSGNAKVPEGSKLKWDVVTSDTDTFKLSAEKNYTFLNYDEKRFEFETLAKNSFRYSFVYLNDFFRQGDNLEYRIEAIADEYPSIDIIEAVDSVSYNIVYFKGKISDDYGFSKLQFRIVNDYIDSVIPVEFNKNSVESEFYYAFDFSSIDYPGYQYFFKVYDNDVLHGYKSTQSEIFSFNLPDYDEKNRVENSKTDNIEELIRRGNELSEDIRFKLDDFMKSQINSELTDWQRELKLNEINIKRKELEETIEKIKSQNKTLNNFRNSFTDNSLDIIKKQQELEKMIDELFSGEIRELMDRLNELAGEYDKKKFDELRKRIDYSLKDFEKQLDRNLNIMRRMHIEQKVRMVAEYMDKIVSEQSKVAKSLKKRDKEIGDAAREIDREKENFNKAVNELKSIKEKNVKLTSPVNIADNDSLVEEIQNLYKRLGNESNSGNRNKYSKRIDEVNESIDHLSGLLRSSLEKSEIAMKIENLQHLKNLLKKLVYFSFDQEYILKDMTNVSSSDPRIIHIMDRQRELSDIKRSFTDSLYSIAERTPQIGANVYSELLTLDYEIERAIKLIENGNYKSAEISQRLTINSVNMLALFLDEIVDRINELLDNAMPGEGNGNIEGKEQYFNKLKEGQEAFKKQLEEMIKQMESGEDITGGQLGRALMQQEILRDIINDVLTDGGVSNESSQKLKNANHLIEQNIKDIVNNKIDRGTILRQNSIFKYLLDAENAEMKKGYDEERESVTAKKVSQEEAREFFGGVIKPDNIDNEGFDMLPVRMNRFYKTKYKSYKVLIDE